VVVVTGVDRDPVEPGALVELAVVAQLLVGLEEDFLGDVAGVFTVTREPQREVVDTDRVLFVQVGERRLAGFVLTRAFQRGLQSCPLCS
jgi:hypothetical protein